MKAAQRTAMLVIAAIVGFAAPITLYAGGSRYFEPVVTGKVMPSTEILNRVRALALDPIGEPLRRGPYYVLHAYDRYGIEVRVVADAHFGDVLSVVPVPLFPIEPGLGTVGGAHIIHVPPPGEAPADRPSPAPLDAAPAAPPGRR
jgi:hypothetical protein